MPHPPVTDDARVGAGLKNRIMMHPDITIAMVLADI